MEERRAGKTSKVQSSVRLPLGSMRHPFPIQEEQNNPHAHDKNDAEYQDRARVLGSPVSPLEDVSLFEDLPLRCYRE